MRKSERRRAAVLGFPVSHSLSPRLHNYWLKQYGIEGSYEAIAVTPDNLAQVLRALPKEGFSGVNLTIPHKEAALALMDEVDDDARRIGAINTIVVREGRLLGANTDAYGFIASLKAEMYDYPEQNYPAGKALVLGAGGAARAVCAGLIKEGWTIVLAARTRAKAEAIAANFDRAVQVTDWPDAQKAMEGVSLLVNTTPLGMKGQQPLDINIEPLPKNAWVSDIVYAPQKTALTEKYGDPTTTDLLARAMDRKLSIVGGLGMLLYQAQPAFEAWFGVRPEVTDELYHYMLGAL